jgi:hypothetical protein
VFRPSAYQWLLRLTSCLVQGGQLVESQDTLGHPGHVGQCTVGQKVSGNPAIGAVMSKLDKKDAYKLIPAKKADWRLQCMSWDGRFFHRLERHLRRHSLRHKLRCPGGHHPGYCHLKDRNSQEVGAQDPGRQSGHLANPVRLDPRLHRSYTEFCKDLNIKLAQPCPRKDKAFYNETSGRVLGIWFDSSDLSWSYPEDKAIPLIREVLIMLEIGEANLKTMQSVMGSINDVASLCPFLKEWRLPSLSIQSSFQEREDIVLPGPAQVRADMMVCCRVIMAAKGGLPLAPVRQDRP